MTSGDLGETTFYKFGDWTIERTRIAHSVECISKKDVQVFENADKELNEFIINTQSVSTKRETINTDKFRNTINCNFMPLCVDASGNDCKK